MNQSAEAIRDRVARNWRDVVGAVARACEDAGRNPSEVQIIGVSKYVDAVTTAVLVEAGCRDLGESRPQSIWQKAETLKADLAVDPCRIHWHAIGHVQRNKVRRLIRNPTTVHSVDSERILRSIADQSVAADKTTPVLIEVNISGDEAKTGLSPQEVESLLGSRPDNGVHIIGLMAMAGWGTDPDQARGQFAAVRRLRDRLAPLVGLPLSELSMGMSGDFAAAIDEGSTMVRIGSRLFEGVPRM